MRTASRQGAEAVLTFAGTGAILSGSCLDAGGAADVYLDGKLERTVDMYSDVEGSPGGTLWHTWGFKNARRAVRIVVRGEPFRDSKGSEIRLDDGIILR